MQRVFLVGRLRACPHRRRGLLTVPLELGSRESVKLYQIGTNSEIAAHSGGFFVYLLRKHTKNSTKVRLRTPKEFLIGQICLYLIISRLHVKY